MPENADPASNCLRGAFEAKTIPPALDFDSEVLLDLLQMLIELTAQIGQTSIVGGVQNQLLKFSAVVSDAA